MTISPRVLADAALRAVALVLLAEAATALDSLATSTDDALATGLTYLFVLAAGAAVWGLRDGLRRAWPQLTVTWVATAALASIFTVRSLASWSELAFIAAVVAIPSLCLGLVASLSQRSHDVGTMSPRRRGVRL